MSQSSNSKNIVVSQRQNVREEILAYYNNDRGLVISAIQEAEERAQRAQQQAARLENARKMAFLLCHDLLHELWELEKSGILMIDEKATFGSLITAEEGAEAYSLILSSGDILTVYSSPTQPCRVTWTAESQVIRESVIVFPNGDTLSDTDIIHIFMDIASKFMNSFIVNNNICR